jgi:DNA modification methylase
MSENREVLIIIYKSVIDLEGYKNNSRTHSEEQILQIANSINEFGFTNPILIQKNQIIAGHGRLAAAKSIGLDLIPTIELKNLTADQVRALVIADNQLALNAGWDLDILKSELDELKLAEFDIDLLGFDDDFLDGLLECETIDGLTDEDDVPEAPEDPLTVLGDIWELGNHRLMCGDSTSIDAADLLLDGATADMVNTDPPYGVSYQSNMRTKSDKFDVLENDDKILDIAAVIDSCSKGWVFVWTSWKVITKWIDQFESFGYPSNQVIWFKGGGGIGDLKKTFSSDYETALVWHRGHELTGKRIGSVWKVGKDGAAGYMHPTQKPVALAEEAIDKTTRQNDIILDLFGGSGSTLMACEKINRRARLMELDPKYCDVIIKRWEEFTGKEAIHLDTGKTYKELTKDAEVS